MRKEKTILLIDDEEDVLDFLSYNLKKAGYNVFQSSSSLKGLEMAKSIQPSLILLDLMMPEMDGIETCQNIRSNSILTSQPIIAFLTSRPEDYSQIAAFEAGADDYLVKPIRPRLLVSKIDSLFRRIIPEIKNQKESNLIIDRERFKITFKGESLELPKKEFELLEYLASKPGKVFNREHILSMIWGDNTIVGERTVDVHVRKLREKLGNEYIRTIKGVGYTFSEF